MVTSRKITEILMKLLIIGPLITIIGILFPFTLPRAVWMLTFGLLVIVAGLVAIKDLRTFRITWVDGAFLTFNLLLLVTALTGVDSNNSFWSEAGRAMGVVFFLAMSGVYIVGRFIEWNVAEWKTLWHYTFGVLLVSCSVAVVQLLDTNFLPTIAAGRVAGLLGNPLIFASYLAPYLFIAVALMAEKTRLGFSRIFVSFVLPLSMVLVIVLIIFSRTRGAMLGIGVGVVTFFIGALLHARGTSPLAKYKKIIFGIFAALVILYGATFVGARVTQNPYLLRATFSLADTTTLKTRLINWKIAVQAFTDRPVLGLGWENYRVATDKYFNPALSALSIYETRADKPHNAWLEILVTTGIFGLLAYVALVGSVMYSFLRAARTGVMHPLAAWGFIAAIVCHEVTNFFGFDTHSTWWIMVMLTLFAAPFAPQLLAINVDVFWKRSRQLIIGIAAVIALFVGVYGAWAPLRNGYYIQLALDAMEHQDMTQVSRSFSAVHGSLEGPYKFDNWRWLAHATLYNFAAEKDKPENMSPSVRRAWEEDVEEIAQQTKRLAASHMDSASWMLFAGKLEYHLGLVRDNPDHLKQALVYFERTQVLAPMRQEAVVVSAYALALLGENTRAVDKFIVASNISASAEINDLSYFLAARFDTEKDFGNAVRLFEYLVAVRPSAEYYARLAAAYAGIGRSADARTAVARAVQLDASFAADAEIFLKQLPK